MPLFLSTILIFSSLLVAEKSHGDMEEVCRGVVRLNDREIMRAKRPNATDEQLDAKMNEESKLITSQYLFDAKTKVCLILQAQKAITADKNKLAYCPKTATKYKIDCFREWIKKRKMSYTGEWVQVSTTATELANLDKTQFGKTNPYLVPLMLDTILSSLERFSTAQNLAFNPILKGSEGYDQKILQDVERSNFESARRDIIPLLTQEATKLKDGISRAPASDSGDGLDWLKKLLLKYDKRIAAQSTRKI